MFRRTLSLIGTTTFSLIALLGLIWFASSSFSVAHAESPAIDTANTALPRPLHQVPPGCVPVISDIASDTTWTGSCYHVMTNTVSVYTGISLTINPPSAGTWVYFEGGAQLQVLGNFYALGTTARPITFTAVHTSDPWLGIILEGNGGGDQVQHSVIEYAQTGIKINDEDSITIQFNTFRHNRLGPTGGGGVGGDTDGSFITNNTIHDCSNGVTLNESFTNDISGNTIYDVDQYGVALLAKTTVGGDSNTINDNEIYDCGMNSIRLESGDWNTVQGNTIYQSGNAGLVIDYQSDSSVENNQVFDNAQDAGALAGILVTNGSQNVGITANRILSNGSSLGGYVAAVYVQDTSSVFNQLTVNGNLIHDTYGTGVYYAADNGEFQTVMQANAICSVPSFELDNQRAGHTIDARYGWWGTNTPAVGVNYAGSASLTPWITLSVTTVPTAVPGNLGSTVNVLVTMNDGAGHTVPDGARQVRLASSSGTLNPSEVTLDDNGQALSTFTLTEIPPGDQVTISATAFCDYVASAILTVERTNVAIDKEVSVTQAMAGGQLVYQITYSNTTDVVATNVYITDSLPSGTTWAADTAAASGWTRLSTSPQPVWFVPTLSPGASGSFALTVDVSASAACAALMTNWVNIGTDTAETTTADNTASAGPVEVIQPSVVVSKTGDAHSKVGDTVTYQFQITNNSCPASSPPLILDSVVDASIGWPGLGSLTNLARANGCDPLSYGSSCSFTAQHTVQAGEPDPLHNGVDVHYHPQGFTVDVSDSDVHSVNLFQPSITFDKTGGAQGKVGDDVDYTLTLNNTSSLDAPDLVCTITDAMLGIDQNVTLASGGSHVINVTYTVPGGAPDPLVNTAQVSCSPIGFPNVLTANDSHSVNLFQPSITFDKTGDARSKVGDDVDYTLTLNNTSSSDAPDLVCTITDAMLGIDQNVTLASGGSHVVNATYTVPGGAPDPLVNTAQVSCSPIGFPNVLTANDSHSVDLFQPSIQVVKTGPGLAYNSETITYTFRITNTSSLDSPPLILDSVDDVGTGWPGLGDLTITALANGCSSLFVGDSCSFAVQYTPMDCNISPLVNTVTPRYHPLGFSNVISHSDGHAMEVQCAVDLVVEKDDDVGPTLPGLRLLHLQVSSPDLPMQVTQYRDFVGPGDLITYTIFVQNNATVTATNVVLSDTLPDFTTYVGYGWQQVGTTRDYTIAVRDLSPGDIEAVNFVVRLDDPLPTAVRSIINDQACGSSAEPDLNYDDNCDLEDSPVRWVRLDVNKGADPLSVRPGQQVTYTLTVTNLGQAIGDGASSGITITDALPDGFAWVADTAPSAGLTRLSTQPPTWYAPVLTVGERISFILVAQVTTTVDTEDCMNWLPNVMTGAVKLGDQVHEWSAVADVSLYCLPNLFVTKHDDVETGAPLRAVPEARADQRPIVIQLLQEAQASSPMAPAQPRQFVLSGDLVTYTVTVINTGAYTATGVVLTETLPLYTDYVGYGWTHGGGRTYVLTAGALAPYDWRIYQFVVRVADDVPSGVNHLTNLVCGGSAGEDLDPSDNCRYEDTPVLGLSINKVANSTSIQPGQLITYTITLDNLDQISAFGPSGGITITDALPAGFTYVADTAASAGFARLATSPLVVWHAPTTTLGSNVSFSLVARAPAAINCANWMTNTVTASLTLNGQPHDWIATAGVWIPCPTDLLVLKDDDVGPTALMSAKAATPGTQVTMDQLLQRSQVNAPLAPVQHRDFVREGDLITYTIAVFNVGTDPVANVVLSETLPVHTDYVGYGWTHLGGRTYTAPVGTLLPGEAQIHYFVVQVHDTLPDGVENLVNQVCGWADEPDQYPQNNCNYEDTPVRRRPLQVIKGADPCISPGDAFDYTITYRNISTGTTFYDVLLTDTLDPHVSYTGGPEWSCTAGVCNRTIPAIPPGVSDTLQLPAQLSASFPAAQTAFTNTVVISGGNRFVLVTPVDTAPDLSVLKNDNVGPLPLVQQAQWDNMRQHLSLSHQPASIQATQQREFVYPGELITYTILYVNSGQTTATNVVLTERLPDYTSYVGGGWTYAGGQQYTLSVGDLAPGQGGEVQFIVQVSDFFPPGEDRVVNRVNIAGQETECNLSNNQSVDDTPVHPYPLQVIKTADTCIVPGDEFNYTVTYQNTTTDTTYSNVVLTDTLSPYVTYAGGPEWTCVGQTCTRTIATVPPGGSDSFPLQAQLSASFPYTMQTVFTNVVAISGGNRYLLITSIDVGPDLALVKNDNVGLAPPGMQQREVVLPGELITYTILYVNGGLGTATNVVLTETLPQYTTYAGDASWQDAGGGLYTRSVGDLVAGQGGFTSFIVRVDDPLPANVNWAINQVEIGSGTPECNLTNNQSFEQTPLSSDGVLTFTLHKDSPMSTYPNSVITYTIVTVNNGPSTPGVTLSDTVPNGTIFIPGSCSYSINGGPGQPCDANYPDPSDVMWQEDLATGDRVVTTFSVRVAVGTMGVVMLQNCATLDWGGGQMADCADTMVVLPFLEKTGPATAGSGERITYTIVSENNTDMPIPDATLSDPIPNGASFVPGTCSYSMNGGTFQSCALDYPSLSDVMWQENLAPGDRITTTFSVVVITGTMGVADVQNCVTLGWQGSQTVNCFTTRITSTGPILYKTAPQVACQNDVITYTIVASNVTGLAVPGVILSDTIPNGAVYVPGSCYYQVNAGLPQPCGLPPLLWQEDFAPGDRITTTFAVTVTAGTMGWPIGNCAVFNWGGRQLWACATTIVGRCDQRVYVANRDSGTVDVFDLNGYSYVETIPMGINPFGMVMVGDFLFAADFDEPANRGRLYVVNTLLDRVVDSPLVGAHPIHIAAYDHHIYVASHSSRPAITVYDYASGQIVAQPLLDRHLTYEFGFFGATTDESRGCVYFTKRDFGSLGIWRICPPSSSGPWIPEFVYGTDETNREKPSSILYHPDLDHVYVTFGLIDELWVFDPETWQLAERLPTGVQDPTDPGYGGHGLASLGECIFVANYLGQSVTAVVDGSCVDRTRVMATPPDPSTSKAHRVYLPLVIKNFGAGQQGPQQQRIVTIPVSGRPKGMVAGAGNLLFVTMPEDGGGNPLNRVAVIDTETLQVVHEIQALGDHPHTAVLRQITVPGTRSKPSGTLLLP